MTADYASYYAVVAAAAAYFAAASVYDVDSAFFTIEADYAAAYAAGWAMVATEVCALIP